MDKLVKVKNFPNRMTADIASQILEQEDIACIIQCIDKGISGTAAVMPQGADLYVQEEDFKKSQEILINIFNGI